MEKVIETPEFILSMPWRWRRNFSPRYHYNFKKKAKKRKEKKRKIWSGRFCWVNHLFRDLVIKNMRSWYSDFGYERVMSNLKKCYEHCHNSSGKKHLILSRSFYLWTALKFSPQQQRWPREIRKTAAFPSLLLLLCSSKRHNRPAKYRNLDKTTKILTATAFYLTLISL